ncbi:hypothetical protein KP509_22G034200 [Ceratopteris richardii]|uniref:SBP-type domain-containing protein n=1 Tax=Ceratopteris richardii TaxID=49495 RepID=A0A8T2S736_CERRI|nr:hypothetical protein KP509_22G034200 [Ceratopteris richardii]KAH7306850.1 hypothetical protein KP509_22G034200 [Ceratopteris richardii]KAH7306851.1 hypothetical protein KP509_22G034200 [Ceratopteris richardii]
MADSNYVLESWDLETLFASSLLDHDLTWHGELPIPDYVNAAPMGLSANIQLPYSASALNFDESHTSVRSIAEGEGYGTPVAASSTVVAANTSDGSLDSSVYDQQDPPSSHRLQSSGASFINPPAAGTYKKKKKRDPRLECPNFLAGRIPCSCPEEDELEPDVEVDALVTKKSKVAARCQVPSCGEDISHLKGYHQRHRVCLTCANSPKVILKDQAHRYCQQCGKFHRLSDFDEGKRSCRRKLERHNRRRRRRPVEGEGNMEDCEDPSVAWTATKNAHTPAASKGKSKGSNAVHLQKKKDAARDDQHASDSLSESVRRFEEDIISSSEGKLDDHPRVDVVLTSLNESAEQDSRNMKLCLKSSSPSTPHMSTNEWKCTDYISPCPTGRISFKLYDWNPADFPRRLREQICEWLKSMPAELESYVRSGCIILTFFVAMPQLMWDKVLAGWKDQVQAFILKSGVKLLGSAELTVGTTEKSLCLENGRVTNAYHRDLLIPIIVDLYPRSIEAGCCIQLYVFGFNFSGGKFLLSFGEQYVECSECEAVDRCQCTARGFWNTLDDIEVQKVTVRLPDTPKFGLAYMEVENSQGLSNFIPVLVADRLVCADINKMKFRHQYSSSSRALDCSDNEAVKQVKFHPSSDLISDLGWTLSYMHGNHPNGSIETLNWQLQRLLVFFSELHCHAVASYLVQTTFSKFLTQNIYNFHDLHLWNIHDTSKNMKAISCHDHSRMPVNYVSIITTGDRPSPHEIHNLSKEKDLELLDAATEESPLLQRNTQGEDSSCLLPMELPWLKEKVPIPGDVWRQKSSFSWSLNCRRRPQGIGSASLQGGTRRFTRILVAVVGVVAVCTGACLMLQHPREVAEFSMSFRRCLWGSTGTKHV